MREDERRRTIRAAFTVSSVIGATYRLRILGDTTPARSSQLWSHSIASATSIPQTIDVTTDRSGTSLKLSITHSAMRKATTGTSARAT